MDQQPAPTINDLFPELSGAELREAEDNLEQYLALALRIYQRIIADPVAYAQFKALTGSGSTVR